jgi:Fe-S oxidoreductase
MGLSAINSRDNFDPVDGTADASTNQIRIFRRIYSSGQGTPMQVALMIPCYVDLFYPEVGTAGLELLEKLKVEVVYPFRPNLLRSADGE